MLSAAQHRQAAAAAARGARLAPRPAAGAAPRPTARAARAGPPAPHRRRSPAPPAAAAATAAPPAPPHAAPAPGGGHSALLRGLGDTGDVPPALMPFLLRLAHILGHAEGRDSAAALSESARGVMGWRACLNRGLLPDLEALSQCARDGEAFAAGRSAEELLWPEEPLRGALLRGLSRLGVARLAKKYPAVEEALLRSVLGTVVAYYKELLGVQEEEEAPEVDEYGTVYKTVAQLAEEEAAARAARSGAGGGGGAAEAVQPAQPKKQKKPSLVEQLPPDRAAAVRHVRELYQKWEAPVQTLSRAGRAFEGLEALLGGDGFQLEGNIWKRQGWAALDELRRKLENLRELRDLVRSLGRGGGWGPLRRAPVQRLDMSGRPGLLRTVLEAQETRGLTRSGDISRLLPAEAAVLARGRTVRQSKLLFFARLAEKGLQTYERDGWGEFPTKINPDRREIRPTADRGPILLCVDTSGSMRGARESVAKALALECMRAAREQERDCYVFAFSGPQEVRELELNDDMRSVNNLLDFMEKIFNGGSDFNEPVSRCLSRLTDAKWANSDILLVSDGELRQPGHEIMRKLAGAKDKLALRVHGLIIGSPEKQRADPAVLRALCTSYLPNGKVETLVSEFSDWASVQDDESMQYDWDDAEGNTRRRLAGLAREKARQAEMRRLRQDERRSGGGGAGQAASLMDGVMSTAVNRGKKL
ncbi:hypothetical protein Rsub_08380 [Raphidocelis subcapitata]|uniref:VWFA domain-containing protein n=1 Tax=Raphidocelis subcapitata TaxID=307507 RepID=A0A2V0P6D1_9CHLO|nr:hypothetical protein Rsub_08380 [Raphidocelis subcapitata]|eukprot:GBF95418.1 hypothetical protein Rsub_08380 [Raphidocelis subcapitata]